MAHTYPTSFYEELIAMGDGLMRGEVIAAKLEGHESEQHYMQQQIDLYEHIGGFVCSNEHALSPFNRIGLALPSVIESWQSGGGKERR